MASHLGQPLPQLPDVLLVLGALRLRLAGRLGHGLLLGGQDLRPVASDQPLHLHLETLGSWSHASIRNVRSSIH